jgi:hypothetical protein
MLFHQSSALAELVLDRLDLMNEVSSEDTLSLAKPASPPLKPLEKLGSVTQSRFPYNHFLFSFILTDF